MAKLNTESVKTDGGGTPKSLQPGNTICKIVSVNLEEFKFKEGGYHVILNLEGKDLGPDFQGFFIDKDKPELGHYKGQVGKVRGTEYAFADGETKTGIKVSRDNEIMKFVKTLCVNLDIMKWWDAQTNKHDTIESLVKTFNDEKSYAGIFMKYCLAGKEYTSKTNYTNYELFLPKFSKDGNPFEGLKVAVSKLAKFNETLHIRKKKVDAVSEFGETTTGTGEDFVL